MKAYTAKLSIYSNDPMLHSLRKKFPHSCHHLCSSEPLQNYDRDSEGRHATQVLLVSLPSMRGTLEAVTMH